MSANAIQSREELLERLSDMSKRLEEKEWLERQMQRSIEQMTETISFLEGQCKIAAENISSLEETIRAYERQHEQDQEKKESLRQQRSELGRQLTIAMRK